MRSRPGQAGGEHVASSYEHDEEGFEREEEDNKIRMATKRFKKLGEAAKEIPQPQFLGPEDAELTIVTWGSTKGPVLEAMRLLEKGGLKANLLQIVFISPFPTETVEKILKRAKTTVIVEGNQTSQMASVIREKTGIEIENKILRFDGRPFSPEDLFTSFKELIAKRELTKEFSGNNNGG